MWGSDVGEDEGEDEGKTDKTRDPGPYCPDTGQAQTTCSALLAASGTLLLLRLFDRLDGRVGMVSHGGVLSVEFWVTVGRGGQLRDGI